MAFEVAYGRVLGGHGRRAKVFGVLLRGENALDKGAADGMGFQKVKKG